MKYIKFKCFVALKPYAPDSQNNLNVDMICTMETKVVTKTMFMNLISKRNPNWDCDWAFGKGTQFEVMPACSRCFCQVLSCVVSGSIRSLVHSVDRAESDFLWRISCPLNRVFLSFHLWMNCHPQSSTWEMNWKKVKKTRKYLIYVHLFELSILVNINSI